MPALLTHCMFDVSLRTKLSVSVLAQRKIESARPRKHGLFLRTEEKMRLYGRTLEPVLNWWIPKGVAA